ncbi:NAD-dependent glycerol-3-phosphate dehydrogenase family protein, putative [Babesia ovata]|uniref:NAD-dependent glycerol-3-phosphate dehydrogenase family protein, putative n=1 Tax=Babesia ovata TaxID=189622 RepID=A0A2H6KCJ8_9APIC|nr:NAD-dependent glycerol-3-phosphate dehydrogenase family protein, putative [Babesia ovata]GBE60723.1 NAD-dependent glycerol-3-phosphate dehydrogenase family protein, putative [Babesia ovata]
MCFDEVKIEGVDKRYHQAVVDEQVAGLRVSGEVIKLPPAVPTPEYGAGYFDVVARCPKLDQEFKQIGVVTFQVLRHLVPDVWSYDNPGVCGFFREALYEREERLEAQGTPAVTCDKVFEWRCPCFGGLDGEIAHCEAER